MNLTIPAFFPTLFIAIMIISTLPFTTILGLRTSFSILSCLRFSLPLLSHLTSPITIHIFTFRGGIVPTSTIRITPGLRFMLWSWSSCSCSWGEGLTGFLSTFYCLVWFVEMWYDFGIKAENIQETLSVSATWNKINQIYYLTFPGWVTVSESWAETLMFTFFLSMESALIVISLSN